MRIMRWQNNGYEMERAEMKWFYLCAAAVCLISARLQMHDHPAASVFVLLGSAYFGGRAIAEFWRKTK